MAEIDREPGGSTMIRVSVEVKEMIESEKLIPREPLNDCIKRGILENRRYKQERHDIETRERLLLELEGAVVNTNVPESGGWLQGYRRLWQKFHPDESLTKEDHIHHINGNHNDDRPENLMKVTPKEHGEHTSEIFSGDPPRERNEKVVGKDI